MIRVHRHQCLGELLDDALATYPSDDALIEVDRDRELARLTYAQLRDASDRVRGWLDAAGLEPGQRVAFLAANQSAWIAAATGVLRAGLTIVPLDPRLTPEEQAALIRHAHAAALVVDDVLLARLEQALGDDTPGAILTLGQAGAAPGSRGVTRYTDLPSAPWRPHVPARREDVAAIVYSSGTGGSPKGCLLPHRAYLAQYEALADTFTWRRGDRYLSILPSNHAIDFMTGFLAALGTGSTVIHLRTLRPDAILSAMRRYRVTQLSVVPLVLTAFARALDHRLAEASPAAQTALTALTALHRTLTPRAPHKTLAKWLLKPVHDAFGGELRMIFCGGAFTDPALAARFADLGLPVAIGYGLTEATTVVTVNDLRPFRADTVGAPVPGVEVRIAEPGADGVGEVQVRGDTVFLGYLHAPEATAAAFTDDGWLRTGDLGWMDASLHLHLVGRRKNLIVTPGGKNVYPEDVEHAFSDLDAEELALFAEDYVFPKRGHLGAERLLLVVRGTGDAARLAREVALRNRRLPDHKRAGALLVTDAPFPRTTSLKVKRDALAAHLRDVHAADDVVDLP